MIIKLPIELGQTVYFVPSTANYQINIVNRMEEHNRIYKQKIIEVRVNNNGWYAIGDKDSEYGTGGTFLDKFYQKDWFLTEDEASIRLQELEEGASYLKKLEEQE